MVMLHELQRMWSAQFKWNAHFGFIARAFAFTCGLIAPAMAPVFGEVQPLSEALPSLAPSAVLDATGGRPDKNSVGSGRNVALYAGQPSKFFFATHSLGDVFSAADGRVLS